MGGDPIPGPLDKLRDWFEAVKREPNKHAFYETQYIDNCICKKIPRDNIDVNIKK